MLLHELAREQVDPGGHGRVRREDVARLRDLARLGEAEPALGAQLADALEAEERGVALVGVAHGRPQARDLEGTHAADAEDDLLPDPHVDVAAVEAVRDLAIRGTVRGQVRVEEQEGRPADPHAPDQEVDVPLGDAHGHDRGDAGRRREDLDREVERIDDGIALLLPGVRREHLPEEALPVEDPDPDERHAEVARGLQVVAGQDAEAARVDREHLGEAELGAEVRDAVAPGGEGGDPRARGRSGVLGREGGRGLLDACDVVRIRGERREPRRVHHPQEQNGISRAMPLLRIELAKESARMRPPRPPHVAGEVGEGSELRRQGGGGAVCSERSHGRAEDNRSRQGFIARTVLTSASRSAMCGSYGRYDPASGTSRYSVSHL